MAVYGTIPYGSPIVLHFNPPQATPKIVPEMNLNSFDYFWKTNIRTIPGTREELWRIFLNPVTQFQEGSSLRMVAGDGQGPCQSNHILSMNDCISLSKEFGLLIDYHHTHLTDEEADMLFPSYLLHFLDPFPKLDLMPTPFFLRDGDLRIRMGSFTNAMQAVLLSTSFRFLLNVMVFSQIDNDSPKFQFAVIQFFNTSPLPTVPNLPRNSCLVCLNAKDIALPSIITNFNTVYERCRPIIVVIFEIRNTVANLSEVVRILFGNYRFASSPLRCYAGGAAMLWRDVFVKGRVRMQSPAS